MLNKKKICEYDFECYGKLIEIKRTKEEIEKYKKKVKEYIKKKKYDGLVKSLKGFNYNDAEKIEFCKFTLKNFYDAATSLSGVYLWVVDDKPIYVGETIDMKKRFNTGYGNISPRNIFKNGQSTNCKVNRVALENFKKGKEINIYFYGTNEDDRKMIEKRILEDNDNNEYYLYNNQNN